jgi:lysophospholipase L1-like esterase
LLFNAKGTLVNLKSIAVFALALFFLCAAPLRAGLLTGDGIGAYGDSLSWQYSLWVPLASGFGYPLYSDGHQLNWVDQLVMSNYNFGPLTDFTGNGNYYNSNDVALGGAVSSDLPGQVSALQPALASNAVKLTVLGIGGNNFTVGVGGEYGTIYSSAASASYNPLTDPAVQTFVNNLVGDITSAVNATLAINPNEHMILMTVPDLGFTPSYRSSYPVASRRADVTSVVNEVNQRILSLAAQHHMPVVDLNALGQLSLTPPKLAGIQMLTGSGSGVNSGNRMYLSDGFHPGTVANGLLANAILTADQIGYGDTVNLISDQTIVTRAGLRPTVAGPTYYDVSHYVIYNPVPEPSTIVLAAAGAVGVAVAGMRRQRRR